METKNTILVVDDDPDIRSATARLLGKAGYSVAEAGNGTEGIRVIQETRPDMVLLDVVLPDMDGHTVCQRIKTDQNMKGTYVLMVSGSRTASDDQSEGLEIGADGYINRPIPNRELLARIHAMFRIIHAERERDRLIGELQEAFARIKTLSGLLPICSYCKKIRDETGYWSQVEVYIQKHSDADFSHSICSECMKKYFPEFTEEEDES